MNNSQVLIRFSSFKNPGNCSTDGGGPTNAGHAIINPETNPASYSMLLTAFAAQKNVDVYVTANCTSIWAGTSYSPIHHVRVYQ